ncbi:unnamed protein product [Caenorhabditis auriculariae]|uniref:Uncharacterized protein n=1 Tax=Caenorhabditis auriculariae TaxID=2777116 RepID=A0A8S1HL53_9PELO|nr:unnamed protein product [Caenorhabditis auriculariae]
MKLGSLLLICILEIFSTELPSQYKLANRILTNYQKRLIPQKQANEPINVFFSMELYQVIEVNEPQQFLMINAWIAERWVDKMLGWEPAEFSNLTELMIRHEDIWVPDTTLYNSLAVNNDESRRLLHAKLTTMGRQGAMVEILYPTIYKISCMLNLRFFPFDVQTCKMTFGSWSFDSTLIDYYPKNESQGIGTINCLENEGWSILSSRVQRVQHKYECCPNKYTLLEFYLKIQRKPLYYIINLITPTSIITLISIVGFFTSASINDMRQEKITLGITTLLSMSILIFMVSDKMPSTSSFIPLIGWFYTSMILIISFATIAASIVIYVQRKGVIGKPPQQSTMKWAKSVAALVSIEMPMVMREAYAKKEREEKLRRRQLGIGRRDSLWNKVYRLARDQSQVKKLKKEDENGWPVLGNKSGTATPTKKFNINSEVAFIGDEMKNSTYSDMSTSENGFSSRINPAQDLTRKEQASDEFPEKPIEVQISTFATRNLAQLEWDWLAAVVERVMLLVFIALFLFSSVGINLIGFVHWRYEVGEAIQTW